MPKHLENGHQSPGMTTLAVASPCPKNGVAAKCTVHKGIRRGSQN